MRPCCVRIRLLIAGQAPSPGTSLAEAAKRPVARPMATRDETPLRLGKRPATSWPGRAWGGAAAAARYPFRCAPRTSRPGSAPVASPSRYVTWPATSVAS